VQPSLNSQRFGNAEKLAGTDVVNHPYACGRELRL